MRDNYQYTIAKEIQISKCNKKDEDGCCQELISRTDGRREEKYSCEDLIKKCSCPL